MIPFLFRYWVDPSGKISRRQYRIFLLLYFLVHLPVMTSVFLAFVVLGTNNSQSILQGDQQVKIVILTFVYGGLCLWPLIVASLKRLHDLGLRGRDIFWSLHPVRNFRIGLFLITKHGHLPPD